MRDDVSVIVPTYRRPDLLGRLLVALEPAVKNVAGRAAIVVNDGSHDAAYQKVVERHAGSVDYMVLERNVGPAAARNAGAERVRGGIIVFIDDDCVPPPDWLDHVSAFFEAFPFAAVVGGYTEPMLPEEPGTVGRFTVAAGMNPNPIVVDGIPECLPTACLAVRREWFVKIGGFNDQLGYGGEDRDLTHRLTAAAAPVYVDRSWHVQHDQNWSLRGFCHRALAFGRSAGRRIALMDRGSARGSYERHLDIPTGELIAQLPGTFRRGLSYGTSDEPRIRRWAYGLLAVVWFATFHLAVKQGRKSLHHEI